MNAREERLFGRSGCLGCGREGVLGHPPVLLFHVRDAVMRSRIKILLGFGAKKTGTIDFPRLEIAVASLQLGENQLLLGRGGSWGEGLCDCSHLRPQKMLVTPLFLEDSPS